MRLRLTIGHPERHTIFDGTCPGRDRQSLRDPCGESHVMQKQLRNEHKLDSESSRIVQYLHESFEASSILTITSSRFLIIWRQFWCLGIPTTNFHLGFVWKSKVWEGCRFLKDWNHHTRNFYNDGNHQISLSFVNRCSIFFPIPLRGEDKPVSSGFSTLANIVWMNGSSHWIPQNLREQRRICHMK